MDTSEIVRNGIGCVAVFLSGAGLAKYGHRLGDGSLKVRARLDPGDVLERVFTHSTDLRLHMVNVGRRDMKIAWIGAIYRQPWSVPHVGSVLVARDDVPTRELWLDGFKQQTLAPNGELDLALMPFQLFREDVVRLVVEDVRGRRFYVPRMELRRLHGLRAAWDAKFGALAT